MANESSKSVGAVLVQEGQPVAYAIKALKNSRQNFPQIEKQAYAIRLYRILVNVHERYVGIQSCPKKSNTTTVLERTIAGHN